jgi:hypothetical protein
LRHAEACSQDECFCSVGSFFTGIFQKLPDVSWSLSSSFYRKINKLILLV